MQTRNRVEVTNDDGTKQPASRFQVNDDGTTVDATDQAFYLSTLAPLNIVAAALPGAGAALGLRRTSSRSSSTTTATKRCTAAACA